MNDQFKNNDKNLKSRIEEFICYDESYDDAITALLFGLKEMMGYLYSNYGDQSLFSAVDFINVQMQGSNLPETVKDSLPNHLMALKIIAEAQYYQ